MTPIFLIVSCPMILFIFQQLSLNLFMRIKRTLTWLKYWFVSTQKIQVSLFCWLFHFFPPSPPPLHSVLLIIILLFHLFLLLLILLLLLFILSCSSSSFASTSSSSSSPIFLAHLHTPPPPPPPSPPPPLPPLPPPSHPSPPPPLNYSFFILFFLLSDEYSISVTLSVDSTPFSTPQKWVNKYFVISWIPLVIIMYPNRFLKFQNLERSVGDS